MNRKRLGFILIGAGVALACVVGVLVYTQVKNAKDAIAQLPTRMAVVAIEDIPAASQIKASQIQRILVPDQLTPANAATSIDETVIGKYTPTQILKGQVVVTTLIGDSATKGVPSYSLQRGEVLYAMETQLPSQQAPFALTASNAVRPGDHVDFVYSTIALPPEIANSPEVQTLLRAPAATQFLQTRIILPNIRVERLGVYKPDGTSEQQENAKYMIFLLKREEALVLKWVKDASGFFGNSMELVLRAPSDDVIEDTASLTINLNYMREKYHLPVSPQPVPTASNP